MLTVPIFALLGTAIVAIAALREPAPAPGRRGALLAMGIGWGARLSIALLALAVVPLIQHNTVWLNDEEAFHRATVGLLPNPWDQEIPLGLQHLAGSAYMGLTTALYVAVGPDPNALRLVNVTLGALVMVACVRIAARRFGSRPAVAAGILVGLWPPIVFFSNLIIRDTLVSFSVVAGWWAAVEWSEGRRARAAGVAFLSLVLAAELRQYVAVLIGAGIAASIAYPVVRRMSRPAAAGLVLAVCVAAALTLVARPGLADGVIRQIVYRQMATRMEMLGRLYNLDDHQDPWSGPNGPGTAVVLRETNGADVLLGVIQRRPDLSTAVVAFADDSLRTVPIDDLLTFQHATIPPPWIFHNYVEDLGGVLGGVSDLADTLAADGRFALGCHQR